jgi:hypothetical protein
MNQPPWPSSECALCGNWRLDGKEMRDMPKARAWKGEGSFSDVDPGDQPGLNRKKIAAALGPRVQIPGP